MKKHHALFLLIALLAASFTISARAEESDLPEHGLAAGRGAAEADEDEGPPSKLPFAKFKQAVAKVAMPGFQRMPEMTAEGDHGLILIGENGSGINIMAQRASVGEQFEKGAAGKLARFKHKGRDAFFAQITDDEGEDMAFIVVKYPEHNMGLFITAKPVITREELMKVLAQIEL